MSSRHYQTLMIGLHGYELTAQEEELLRAYSPGGVIIFGRNVSSVRQLADLTAAVYELCAIPPFISIDQEGGLVDRLRPLLGMSLSGAELHECATPEQITSYAKLTGEILTLLGFNLNFAPVLDVQNNEAENALPSRYLGSTADEVIENGSAFLLGLRKAGVQGCLKHFPGLGRTTEDSHFTLPVNTRNMNELEAEELRPFITLQALAGMLMVAHCHFTAFDPDTTLPASISPAVYNWIREKLPFSGVVITDDLSMAGISKGADCRALVEKPLNAGADLLPFCNNFSCIESCFELLDSALKEGTIAESRVADAADRIHRLKKEIPASYSPGIRVEQTFARLKEDMNTLRLQVMTNA